MPVAIVTGGSRGIGKGIAKELAGLGYAVVVNFYGFRDNQPNDTTARQTQREIRESGGICEICQGDVAGEQDRGALVDFVREKFSRCDMLVNNAGVAPLQRRDILESTEESYDRVMNINLKGPYFLTQRVANWMIEQTKTHSDRSFRICNISSISSYTSSPSRGEYCLSKAGISMMTRLYADRLASYGIGVFEVCPGLVRTDMTSAVREQYDTLIADGLTPIKRWGYPEDIAKAVGAIAQGRLDFSTGQVIHVDGGFHIRRL